MKRSRKIVIAGALALAAVGGAGAAVAASHAWGSDPRQAVINDAAGRLGVTPSALQNAFKARAQGSDRGRRQRGHAHARAGRRDRGQDRRRPGPRLRRLGRGPGGPGGHGGPGGLHGILGSSLDGRDDLPRPDRGAAPDPAPVRQVARPDRQGAGQDRRRADRQTRRPPRRPQLDKAVQDGHLTAAQQTADPHQPRSSGDRHGQRRQGRGPVGCTAARA